ncbi:MAG: tetratricopeptide repeat protein [Armatimonadota bacterium]
MSRGGWRAPWGAGLHAQRRAASDRWLLRLALAAAWACLPAAADSPAAEVAALHARGETMQAAQMACAWAAQEPGNLEALRTWGELALQVGMGRRAEEALRSLVFFAPNDPHGRVLLGRALLAQGRTSEAREQLEQAIHLQPDGAEAYVEFARIARLSAASSGEMLSAAEIAVQIAPRYAPAHAAMGASLREARRYYEALAALEHALELDPRCGDALFELGLTHAVGGAAEQAREAWARLVAVEPHSDRAWLVRNRLVITAERALIDRAFDACYSPDGGRIAYRARGADGWGIYTIGTEGEPTETLLWSTEVQLQSLSWAPDASALLTVAAGRATVDVRGTEREAATRELVVIPTDGQGQARSIMQDAQLGEAGWIPGSGHIGAPGHVRGVGWAILDIDPATGSSTRVPGVDPQFIHQFPAWSADGSLLLAVRRTQGAADGGVLYELLVGPAADFRSARVVFVCDTLPQQSTFARDGAVVVFALPTGQPQAFCVWALPTDGSRDPVPVDPRAGPLGAISFSPDGGFMLSSRGTRLVRLTLDGLGAEP